MSNENDGLIDAEERYCREMIALLKESYERAAKPYVDRLVKLNSIKPPMPICMSFEDAKAIGLIKGGE